MPESQRWSPWSCRKAPNGWEDIKNQRSTPITVDNCDSPCSESETHGIFLPRRCQLNLLSACRTDLRGPKVCRAEEWAGPPWHCLLPGRLGAGPVVLAHSKRCSIVFCVPKPLLARFNFFFLYTALGRSGGGGSRGKLAASALNVSFLSDFKHDSSQFTKALLYFYDVF